LARRKRTAQNLGGPRFSSGKNGNTGSRTRISDAQLSADARVAGRKARTSVRVEVGERQGETELFAEGNEGVGGPRRSVDVGKGLHPDPAEQRRPVSDVNFRREHDRCIDVGETCHRN